MPVERVERGRLTGTEGDVKFGYECLHPLHEVYTTGTATNTDRTGRQTNFCPFHRSGRAPSVRERFRIDRTW